MNARIKTAKKEANTASPGLVKRLFNGFNLCNARSTLNALRQFSFIWLTFILALYLSWLALAQVNFLYPVWYQYAGIKENIQQYAPQNKLRHHFEHTDDASRQALFAGIVRAIHQQGDGLSELYYLVHVPSNAFAVKANPTANLATNPALTTLKIPLLHHAEIVHLTDVAHLIDVLKQLGVGLLLLWMALLLSYSLKKQALPSLKALWVNLAFGLGFISVAVWGLGAKAVFYQLHVWVFPPQNPWFFYYQDSLMSTLMKAPDLFAYIGASLLTLAMVLVVMVFISAQARLKKC